MQIIKLDPDRWEEYKKLRIEAIKNHPPAFLSTIEEAENKTKDDWQMYLKKAQEENSSSMTYFAEVDGKLVGMIAGFHDQREKCKHVANVVSFYVSPESRGKGIGGKLLESIMSWFSTKPFIKKAKLGVYVGNPAVKIYEKFGFEIVGELKDEVKVGDNFYGEYYMEKSL